MVERKEMHGQGFQVRKEEEVDCIYFCKKLNKQEHMLIGKQVHVDLYQFHSHVFSLKYSQYQINLTVIFYIGKMFHLNDNVSVIVQYILKQVNKYQYNTVEIKTFIPCDINIAHTFTD